MILRIRTQVRRDAGFCSLMISETVASVFPVSRMSSMIITCLPPSEGGISLRSERSLLVVERPWYERTEMRPMRIFWGR